MRLGKFFAFEGIDGAGLTTQSSLLKDWFENQGFATFLTKEPTDGPIGSQIRLVLSKRLRMGSTALALAFAADRMDHLDTDIVSKINNGVIVISDRYYLSSYAYQSLDLELGWLANVNSKCLKPHLTILLDVPALICKKRMERMRWHVELYEQTEKLERVRENFLSIAEQMRKNGENIEVVDGNRPLSEIHKDIRIAVMKSLKKTPKEQFLVPSEEKTKRLADFLGGHPP